MTWVLVWHLVFAFWVLFIFSRSLIVKCVLSCTLHDCLHQTSKIFLYELLSHSKVVYFPSIWKMRKGVNMNKFSFCITLKVIEAFLLTTYSKNMSETRQSWKCYLQMPWTKLLFKYNIYTYRVLSLSFLTYK